MSESELQTKKCPRCYETKAAGAFNRCAANPDGLYYYCKKCTSELRWEKIERDFHNPMAEEEKFERQMYKMDKARYRS